MNRFVSIFFSHGGRFASFISKKGFGFWVWVFSCIVIFGCNSLNINIKHFLLFQWIITHHEFTIFHFSHSFLWSTKCTPPIGGSIENIMDTQHINANLNTIQTQQLINSADYKKVAACTAILNIDTIFTVKSWNAFINTNN